MNHAQDFAVEDFVVLLMNGLSFAVAVAIAVWILLRFTPQISAAARHRIWWLALAAALVAPVIPSVLNFLDAPQRPMIAEAPMVDAPRSPLTSSPDTLEPAVPGPSPSEASPSVEFIDRETVSILAGIWLAIVMVQLIRIARSFLYLRSLKSTARNAALPDQARFDHWRFALRIKRDVRLLVSNRIASPLAAGFRHPAVILPESFTGQLSESEIDHVLLHELAHIARRDDWTNLATRLAAAFFVLHPIARWMLKRIDREREIACDDWVVAATGEAKPYARSLARMFELCTTRRRQLLATGMVERASQLRERIEILLGRSVRRRVRASRIRLAFTLAVLAALIIGGACAPPWVALADEQDPPPAPRAVRALPPPKPAPALLPPPAAKGASTPRVAPMPAAEGVPAQPVPPAPVPINGAQKGSLLAALVATGYGSLSVDEIIDLKNNGVTAGFIFGLKESGWGTLTPKQIIQLRVHGVSPAFLGKLRQAGFSSLAAEEIVQLKDGGLQPEEMGDLNALGFGPYTVRQMIDLHNHGVRAPLLRALKDAGFNKLDPREIMEAQMHGLRPEHFREARTYGPSLTLKQIIKLKSAGVI